MRLLVLLMAYFSSGLIALAQEDSYYRVPSKRKVANGQIALPNLKTEKVFWYLHFQAGQKVNASSFENNLSGLVQGQSESGFYWESYLGFNRDDRWNIELGYIKNPIVLDWRIFDRSGREVNYSFRISDIEHLLAANYKKHLLTLDKVTKSARINLIGGLQLSPWLKSKNNFEYQVQIPTLLGQTGYQDTLAINGSINQKSVPVSANVGLELLGRIADQLEVGVFAKYTLRPNGLLNSDLEIDSTLGAKENTRLMLNGRFLSFGLSLRWNLLTGVKYIPDVEED